MKSSLRLYVKLCFIAAIICAITCLLSLSNFTHSFGDGFHIKYIYRLGKKDRFRSNASIATEFDTQPQQLNRHDRASRGSYVGKSKADGAAEIDVLFQFVNAHIEGQITRNLRALLSSTFSRTKSKLAFHVISDNESQSVAEAVFKEMFDLFSTHSHTSRVYYNIYQLHERVQDLVKRLQVLFSRGDGSYYGHILFFVPVALHKVLPQQLKRLVMVDTDIQFRSDIKNLFTLFDNMSASNIMALAMEQQPTYRHITNDYRNVHPGTNVGGPPPNGLAGYNSGIKLVNLETMRTSKVYNDVLKGNKIEELARKYSFKGHLGDQDLFTLLSFEHPELFYTLPCQWNRQLCTWWKDNGYSDIFHKYFDCKPPVFVYHGNCNTPIPD